jgi:hypothetical protein
MARSDPVSIRSGQLELNQIASYYNDTEQALRLYYSAASPHFTTRFVTYQDAEVIKEHSSRLDELEVTCAMTVLSKLEASFRIDYLVRCRRKKRDALTKHFREIYKTKMHKASLDDEILEGWSETYPIYRRLVGEVKGALNYRHWIAHGRYWEPKLARKKYDYLTVYTLAAEVLLTLPFIAVL